MLMQMTIHNPNGLPVIDYRTIKPLQENLKDLHNEQHDQLLRVLQKRGFKQPLNLWLHDNVYYLMDGHQRQRVMLKNDLNDNGNYLVPYFVTEASNKKEAVEQLLEITSQYGKTTPDGLDELASMYELDLNELDIHFDAVDLEKLVGELDKEVEEDEAPEVDEANPPVSVLGEVYQLGRHRLMCGDATDFGAVSELLNGAGISLVLTDPPYNVAGESKNFAADVSKSMNKLSKSEWDKDFNITDTLELLKTVLTTDYSLYIFTSHFLFGSIYEGIKSWTDFTSYCVWNKPNPMPSLSKRHWTWNTELCVYATKGKHTFNFPNGENLLSGWQVTKKSDGSHPTMKPVELMGHIIKHSSNREQSVLDLFGGSGSTLIACEQLDRTCFMMELDPKYCDVIRKRYAKLIEAEDWQAATPKVELVSA